MKKLIYFPIAFFVLASCSPNNKPDNTGKPNSEQPSHLIVLCDLSASIVGSGDNKPIEYIKNGCKTLLKSLPKDSRIDFYVVTSNAAEKPFLSVNIGGVYQTNRSKIKKEFKDNGKIIDSSIDAISKAPEKATCLLSSLEHCYDVFATTSTSAINTKNKIIVFTDLLEECGASPVNDVYMKKNNASLIPNLKELEKLKNYKPRKSFSDLNVEIEICLNSNYLKSNTLSQLDEIWQLILANYGFKNISKPVYKTSLAESAREEYKGF